MLFILILLPFNVYLTQFNVGRFLMVRRRKAHFSIKISAVFQLFNCCSFAVLLEKPKEQQKNSKRNAEEKMVLKVSSTRPI